MINSPEIVYPLLVGFFLDSLLGDPHRVPHPVRAFGWLISKGEKLLNYHAGRKWKGALLSVFLITITFLFFTELFRIISSQFILFVVLASVFVFWGMANRALIHESLLVVRKLEQEGIEAGRKQLSYIVGRETAALNEQQIRTAVLETLAENLSDGVIAPLFYYAIGGIPAMFAYKMANTLDSMIGYKNERYKDFGWFAARFDDVLNFIPARITALLMVLLTCSKRGALFVLKFGRKHSSPNAGYPEAALAGILNCRFGGPNIYHGKCVNKPYIGKNQRILHTRDVYKTCILNFAVTLASVLLIILANIL